MEVENMDRQAIVSINGNHVLCENNQDAATILSLIKCAVTSDGYGKDTIWKEDLSCELSISSVSNDQVKLIDESDGSRDIIKNLQDEKTKKGEELSRVQEELSKEKKFWEVRNKAHALGYTDDQLRDKLKGWYTWTELKLDKQ
jgi:vacuolar-type H+-ATPase subunit I/STV1